MTFAIERAELEAAFGPGTLVSVPEERLNTAVTDPGTRRFLTGTGLPQVPDFLYEPEGTLEEGLPPAAEIEPELPDAEGLPASAGHWVALGYCYGDTMLLDGSTGTVWSLPQGELRVEIANTSVDRFARFLASFFRDFPSFDEGTTLETRLAAAGALTDELRAVDPAAFDDSQGFWCRVLDGLTHDYPG